MTARSAQPTRPRPWVCPASDASIEATIAREVGCTGILARLLANRGISCVAEARGFLDRRLTDLHPPDLFSAMPHAIARLRDALRRGERIAVFGDYDVDGVSGTAIVLLFLRRLKATVEAFLPHRVEEGYGLSRAAIDRMKSWGASLVITVDNGVSSTEAVEYGRGLGLDFIITDHHEAAATVPAGVPILDPKLPGETYPFRDLAGAGVAFKLVWGYACELSGQAKVRADLREFLLHAIALAALGTVADVVPLRGENRILAHHGLTLIKKLDRPGLRELVELTCTDGAPLKAHHIAFRLGPRLNAAGRLGPAERALELLITEDGARAKVLARELDAENNRRRKIEQDIVRQAREDAAEPLARGDVCLVLARPEWHVGVLGIAASRLAEETGRPVILIAIEAEGKGRGSGRSANGVPLYAVLEECRELLDGFGGHAEACGIRIKADRIPAFAEALDRAIRARGAAAIGPFRADMALPPHELTDAVLRDIERLAPFGQGNERPVFVAENLTVVGDIKRMGRDGRTVAFTCRSGPGAFRAVHFGGLDDGEEIATPLTFAYEPYLNSFRGAPELELRVATLL